MNVKFENCKIKASASKEEADKIISTASIEKLAEFLPNVDKSNIDLLPIVVDACVVNEFNKNGDGIDSSVAYNMYKNFAYKPINIEHETQKVIGTILSAAFYDKEHNLIDPEVAKNKTDKYYISLNGVIWKRVNENIANYIEYSSSPQSPNYKELSASWELSFSDYVLMACDMPGDRTMASCSVIPEMEFAQAKNNHPGKSIYRKLIGETLPLGIGIVEFPAADVKGIVTPSTNPEESEMEDDEEDDEEEMEDDEEEEDGEDTEEEDENTEESESNLKSIIEQVAKEVLAEEIKRISTISQDNQSNVITEKLSNNKTNMKISNKSQITDELLKAGTITASSVVDFVSELETLNDKYVKDKTDLENSSNLAKEKIESLSKDLAAAKSEFEKTLAELNDIKAKIAQEEKNKAYQIRMAYFNENYDLSAEASKVLAKKLSSINTDEEFEGFKSDMDIFLTKKNKESKASTEDPEKILDETLKNGKKTTPNVPNKSFSVTDDDIAKAFAEDQFEITIK